MSRAAATLAGTTAILMWSLLALLTAASGRVPPFQLAALSFAVGAVIGLAWVAARGEWRALAQPARVWMLGVGGLFGYHALYFTALRNAPPVEAGLIAYLWPLLIVVGSALLPGERLRARHVVGAVLGLAGTVAVIAGGADGFAFDPRYAVGYAAAFAAAFTWTAYSLLSRLAHAVPTAAVAGFCLATSMLSALAHLTFEETVWPVGAGQWMAVAGLGLMPVGAAFYTWDIGMKRGDVQVLGVLSYAAPLLSTLILVAAGFGALTPGVALAALLITGGALLAASASFGGSKGAGSIWVERSR